MTKLVEITEFRNLDDFRNLIRPVAQAEHDRVAGLTQETSRIRINIEPETAVAIATDEFTRLLPKAYVSCSASQERTCSGRPGLDLSMAVPEDVVVDTIKKMTTLKTT